MNKILVTILALFGSSLLLAQEIVDPQSVLDPANPNTSNLTDSEIAAQLELIQSRSNRVANDLDAGEIDKLVFEILYMQIRKEPEVIQERLKLSDMQLEQATELLSVLNGEILTMQISQMEAMCDRWNDLDSADTVTRIEAAMADYDSKGITESVNLYPKYQNAMRDIRGLLDSSKEDIFVKYIDDQRVRMQNAHTLSFTESLGLFGSSAEQSIRHHCE